MENLLLQVWSLRGKRTSVHAARALVMGHRSQTHSGQGDGGREGKPAAATTGPHQGSSLSPTPLFTAQRTPSGPNKWVSIGKRKKHTHAPSTYKRTFVSGSLKRLTHTKGSPLLPFTPGNRQERRLSDTAQRQRAVAGKRTHTLQTADLIHPQTDTMWRGRLQEMGRLCPRKDFLQAVNGKLTWKARLKIHRLLEAGGQGPLPLQQVSKEATHLEHSPLTRLVRLILA